MVQSDPLLVIMISGTYFPILMVTFSDLFFRYASHNFSFVAFDVAFDQQVFI